MELHCSSPAGKVLNGGGLRLRFAFINRGPDVMYSGDTTLYSLHIAVNGVETYLYVGAMTAVPGDTIEIGDSIVYAHNYGVPFSFPDLTDTLITDFCVVISSYGNNQNGDSVYRFSYIDHNVENNMACNKVTVMPRKPTAITNMAAENSSLLIYPNPAANVLNIKREATAIGIQQATIRDITGRVILEKRFGHTDLNNGILSLNIEQLPVGMYNVSLQSGENVKVEKLVISR